jgi:hypothetical protein
MPLTDASQIPCNHVHFFYGFGGLCGRAVVWVLAGGLLCGDLVGCVDVRVYGCWWGPAVWHLFP